MARVVIYALEFSKASMQMDFSAFYAAGKAINLGLSPYINYLPVNPSLWDGIARYEHSRFLYPPIIADMFQFFAYLSYAVAKKVWTLLNLAGIFMAMLIVSRKFTLSSHARIVAGIYACTFFPLLTLLERGQIDGITLLLVVQSISWFDSKNKTKQFFSGIFLAIAIALKLHTVYFLPFLVFKKKWRTLIGIGVAGVIMITVMISPSNGVQTITNYIVNELPRISIYGEHGPADSLIPDIEFVKITKNYPIGSVDGIRYKKSMFSFVSNGSLIRALFPAGTEIAGIPFSLTLLSILIFGFFMMIIFYFSGFRYRKNTNDFDNHLMYYFMIMVLILLCAPLTWVMNVVWVLPVTFIALQQLENVNNKKNFAMIPLILGILLVWIPDSTVFSLLIPVGLRFEQYKYVIGELLIFFGLLVSYGVKKRVAH